MTPDIPAPVTRVVALDVLLPAVLPVARVEVRRIRMTSGTPAGLHVHNGPVFGNVLTGSAWYQVEGSAARELGPGDVFYEAEGARIARFDAGDGGVDFLGYFPLRDGQQVELTFPDA